MSEAPASGRKAQAARNDELILRAARTVFLANPAAPIAAVAAEANVGISALYRRYPSKEELLRKLCGDGLQTYVDVVEQALADDRDAWTMFADFMRAAIAADTHSLTVKLAGTFTPSPELWALAERAQHLNEQLWERVASAGVIREGVELNDLPMVFEQLASIHGASDERTRQLRARYVELQLDALRAKPRRTRAPLPGPPPTWQELSARWET